LRRLVDQRFAFPCNRAADIHLRAVWKLTLCAGVYQQMVMLRNTLWTMLIFVSLLMASAVVSREYAPSGGIPVFLSHRCSRQKELHTFVSASRSLKSDVR
jgi:hypothetical protein